MQGVSFEGASLAPRMSGACSCVTRQCMGQVYKPFWPPDCSKMHRFAWKFSKKCRGHSRTFFAGRVSIPSRTYHNTAFGRVRGAMACVTDFASKHSGEMMALVVWKKHVVDYDISISEATNFCHAFDLQNIWLNGGFLGDLWASCLYSAVNTESRLVKSGRPILTS